MTVLISLQFHLENQYVVMQTFDYMLQEDMKALIGLRNWENVAREEATFAVEKFSCFLPRRNTIDLGDVWTFVVPNSSRYG